MVGNILNGDGIAVAAFDIIQGFFYIIGFFLLAGMAIARKFAGQKKQVLVQDAVHD